MQKRSLPFFEAALKSGQGYVKKSICARDAQYEFLALTYRASIEGKRCPRIFKKKIEDRLGRSATKPEQNRPYLHLLHALIGTEDNAPRNLAQYTKLTTALEFISSTFDGVKPLPSVDTIVAVIIDSGGIDGMYDLMKVGSSSGTASPQVDTQNVVDLKPNEIHLPMLSARVTKVGRGYRLRMTEYEPGNYVVHMRIGRGGFVEAILDEDVSDEDAA